jgi:hypothetical protein
MSDSQSSFGQLNILTASTFRGLHAVAGIRWGQMKEALLTLEYYVTEGLKISMAQVLLYLQILRGGLYSCGRGCTPDSAERFARWIRNC